MSEAAEELGQWADRLDAAATKALDANPEAAALQVAITQIADTTRALAQDLRSP